MTKEGNPDPNYNIPTEQAQRILASMQPTPPTPAGAGTETPERAKKRAQLEATIADLNDTSDACLRACDELEIMDLQAELLLLRLQAEADRATKQELQEKLGAYLIDLATICAANDIKGLPCQQPRFIGEYIASLRAQLASADKDRERLLVAAKAVYNDLQGLAFAEHGCIELAHDYSPNLHTLVTAIAALQPSPSLDHGARDQP